MHYVIVKIYMKKIQINSRGIQEDGSVYNGIHLHIGDIVADDFKRQ